MDDDYYVVWNGRVPGLYASWAACCAQIDGFEGGRFSRFDSPERAARAWERGPTDEPAVAGARPSRFPDGALAVDAACSGNPGPTEYRGVELSTGAQVFGVGPMFGTNNLGEFLAIATGLRVQHERGCRAPIYSDSRVAIDWVRARRVGLSLPRDDVAAEAWRRADEAVAWLRVNPGHVEVIKWPTRQWGEIPADFGRKRSVSAGPR
jgi:ribonuclease HI